MYCLLSESWSLNHGTRHWLAQRNEYHHLEKHRIEQVRKGRGYLCPEHRQRQSPSLGPRSPPVYLSRCSQASIGHNTLPVSQYFSKRNLTNAKAGCWCHDTGDNQDLIGSAQMVPISRADHKEAGLWGHLLCLCDSTPSSHLCGCPDHSVKGHTG